MTPGKKKQSVTTAKKKNDERSLSKQNNLNSYWKVQT